ncbi:uncharacterized protein A4U43_C02F4890 [Asparagus officinalis]|uniref:Uncharacterized protein n=1 Tax=Asparagus officinalis TaxID=4686 RepID=A0A5P1FIP1_ASPOF|nr:uncharacterized protein A4U43_C02F4890 [Asparagus officinalis]
MATMGQIRSPPKTTATHYKQSTPEYRTVPELHHLKPHPPRRHPENPLQQRGYRQEDVKNHGLHGIEPHEAREAGVSDDAEVEGEEGDEAGEGEGVEEGEEGEERGERRGRRRGKREKRSVRRRWS